MKLKIFLPLLLISIIVSCRVTFQPAYDSGVMSEIKLGRSLTQALYKNAIESPDKSYAASDSTYKMLAAQISSISNKEAARPKSKMLVAQVNELQKLFNWARNEHLRKTVLNLTEIDLYAKYLDDAWKSLINAEQNLPH